MKDLHMKLAIDLAIKAKELNEVPVGCVIQFISMSLRRRIAPVPHPCRGHSGNKLFTNERLRTALPECPQTPASIGSADSPALRNDRPAVGCIARLRHTWQHIGNESWARPETAAGRK